jgi:hypothetical protein
MGNCIVKYTGSTPGADANTYNLLNTTLLGGGSNFFANSGTAKVQLFLKNADTGTLKEYVSEDGGTNWSQISETAVAAAAATGQNAYEFVVEPYRDWKLDWVNGGSAQTTWVVSMALVGGRGAVV